MGARGDVDNVNNRHTQTAAAGSDVSGQRPGGALRRRRRDVPLVGGVVAGRRHLRRVVGVGVTGAKPANKRFSLRSVSKSTFKVS